MCLPFVQGLLTHEVDEGSPCTKCVEGECPGFSLHFWRCVQCVHVSTDVHTHLDLCVDVHVL